MDEEKRIAPSAPLSFSIESLWKRVLGKKVKDRFVEMNEGVDKEDVTSKEG